MPASLHISPRPGLKSFLGGLVALAQVRAQLVGLEAQEQKITLLHNLLIGFLACVCLLAGLMASLLFIALITPPSLRILVFGTIVLLLIMSALGLLLLFFRRLASQPAPFAASVAAICKDWDTISTRTEQ